MEVEVDLVDEGQSLLRDLRVDHVVEPASDKSRSVLQQNDDEMEVELGGMNLG